MVLIDRLKPCMLNAFKAFFVSIQGKSNSNKIKSISFATMSILFIGIFTIIKIGYFNTSTWTIMELLQMTGKERVLKAISCQQVDRIPWVPFVGVHGASLIDMTANDYLKSSEAIVKGVNKAVELYEPDGIPVVFDLQIEAEILGCELKWAKDNPPAVVSHPLSNGIELNSLIVPKADMSRLKVSLDATKKLRKQHPDIALYGLITGPFTLALHLLGTDLFMKMFDNPEYIFQLMEFCRDVNIAVSKYYIEAGCDIVAIVDPMTSQIGPEEFSSFITPYVKAVFESIRKEGAKSSFFVCGHAQQNISAMCDCKPDNVSIDENIPLDFVRDECLKRNISYGGNLQLTSVLLLGNELDSQKDAIRCIDTCNDHGGFLLAPGCDLPFATPPENLKAISEIIIDQYKLDVARNIPQDSCELPVFDMSQYGQSDKVIVDIITLDSEACAPCQYMVDAVRKVLPEFNGIVEMQEHKIKYKESIQFMTSLMVRNIPTICIDGQITFVSRIPPHDELAKAIQKRINEKFSMMVKQRKATLYILDSDDIYSSNIKDRIGQAAQELGVNVDIETITEPTEIASYGAVKSQTPAVVMAQYSLKSARHIPEVAAIKEWLKGV